MRKTSLWLTCSLAMLASSTGLSSECQADVYIVRIDGSRPDNGNGWALWVSRKPVYDDEAFRYPSDLGGRLDITTDSGRLILSMAMNAMNLSYKVSIWDNYGLFGSTCDDFQDIKITSLH